jgi:hypothetical protein
MYKVKMINFRKILKLINITTITISNKRAKRFVIFFETIIYKNSSKPGPSFIRPSSHQSKLNFMLIDIFSQLASAAKTFQSEIE